MLEIFLQDNGRMINFSTQHYMAVGFFILFGWLLISNANKHLNERNKKRLGDFLACSLTFTIVCWSVLKIAINDFDPTEDMPLALCNFIALIMPLMMIRKNQWLFEVFYFLAIAGTLQAIITPDLSTAFPHFSFFKYWYVHCMVVIVTLYATLVYRMRPSIRSIFKVFVAINGYVIFMMIYNLLTGANHLYLMEKPVTATLLDYLGPWPWYILVAEIIAMPIFFLTYLPYLIKDYKTKVAQ